MDSVSLSCFLLIRFGYSIDPKLRSMVTARINYPQGVDAANYLLHIDIQWQGQHVNIKTFCLLTLIHFFPRNIY